VVALYLRLTFTHILVFTTSVIILISLGRTQSIHPTLRGFVENCEGTPQPCWYGIVPGVTALDDTLMILEAQDFVQRGVLPNNYDYVPLSEGSQCNARIGYIQRGEAHIVTVIRLFDCPDVTFGDVSVIFGDVKGITLGSARLLFVLEVSNTLIELDSDSFYPRNPAPYSGVNVVTIWETHVSLADPRYAWHGFVSLWRYCQLEPRVEICF
jgi:hypothetical protein